MLTERAAIRVLVLAESAPCRERLQLLLRGDAALEVVGAVADAGHAPEAAARLQAEVILVGPGRTLADAVAGTRHIMQARATPIVVLTSATGPEHAQEAFALMEAGALAVLHDPRPSSDEARQRVLATVRMMSEVRVVRRWAAAAGSTPATRVAAATPPGTPARAQAAHVALVAIGASTGGPVALKQLLCALPASFAVPIVIVQHMADGFLPGMAQWLSQACGRPVAMATPEARLRPGHACIAPDGRHMRVGADGELAFDTAPPVHGHRPAVGCLFASLAEHYGSRALGILLTGMGRDGAAELRRMKDAGAVTIAQDEASSVVHGMPGEAIRRGGATYVMSPQEMGAALPALVLR
jgi:two-component system chemotaxis response regulator CheB